MSTTPTPPAAQPPAHWSSDVVVSDGGTIHLRPITPDDAPALARFHATLSPQSIHWRYFSAKPELTDDELAHLTTVDHVDRVALVAELGGDLVAVARYERDALGGPAEVAFVVSDAHQGRGIGTLLLEHLAAAGRERGVTTFTADVLAQNRAMLAVFRSAGFQQQAALESTVVSVTMLIEPTDATRAVLEAREHRAEANSVARLLNPRTVAVVGASRSPATAGHQVLRNLLAGRFQGQVFAVNPAADEVAGVPSYSRVQDVPAQLDLAVIAVPAAVVPQTVSECAEAGVRSLVVLSAGFGETGDVAGQTALRDLARRNGMRLVGPNCIGIVNTAVGLDATFSSYPPTPGRIAMQSQSGAVGIALLERCARMGLGVSSFVSVGNKADVSGNDLLQYWEDDPNTDVVLLYLESFGNPGKFSRIARRVSRRKPIVTVKSGRTAAGRRAASSHTAALASSETAVDALLGQAGVIRVDTIDQLFDMALLLGSQPLPSGSRVAVLGNSGGPGILATDACATAGLTVPELSPATQKALRGVIDPNGAAANPVDLIATADAAQYEAALRILLADEGIDAVLVICTPTFASDPAEIAGVLTSLTEVDKPVVGCFLAWPERPQLLRGEGGRRVPTFESPEPAVRALGRAASYGEWRRRSPGTMIELDGFDADRARDVVARYLANEPGGGWLPPNTVTDLLAAAGVQQPPAAVMPADVEEGTTTGVETIVGLTHDRLFGPLVLFGLGGITTELLQDRTVRILPLTDLDAAEMVRGLRSSPLLFGYRGAPGVDTAALELLLQRVARLSSSVPEIVELDLNPVIAMAEGVAVVDARVKIEPVVPGPPADLRRMS